MYFYYIIIYISFIFKKDKDLIKEIEALLNS